MPVKTQTTGAYLRIRSGPAGIRLIPMRYSGTHRQTQLAADEALNALRQQASQLKLSRLRTHDGLEGQLPVGIRLHAEDLKEKTIQQVREIVAKAGFQIGAGEL